MDKIIAYNPCSKCEKDKCNICELNMYRQGIIKQTRYQVKQDGSLEMIPTVESVRQEVAKEIFEELDDIRLKYYEGLHTEEQATEKYLEVQKKYIGE